MSRIVEDYLLNQGVTRIEREQTTGRVLGITRTAQCTLDCRDVELLIKHLEQFDSYQEVYYGN
jgi:hypothetical protein